MPFHARCHDIPLMDEQEINSLLASARSIYDQAEPPDSAECCRDCEALSRILGMLEVA